jgi:hypothetical protein
MALIMGLAPRSRVALTRGHFTATCASYLRSWWRFVPTPGLVEARRATQPHGVNFAAVSSPQGDKTKFMKKIKWLCRLVNSLPKTCGFFEEHPGKQWQIGNWEDRDGFKHSCPCAHGLYVPHSKSKMQMWALLFLFATASLLVSFLSSYFFDREPSRTMAGYFMGKILPLSLVFSAITFVIIGFLALTNPEW